MVRRAFLLEDHDDSAVLMRSLLDLLNYDEVVHAKTLAEAQAYVPDLAEGAFQIAVLDIMLPDGESFQFMADIIEKGAPLVCAYTARTAPDDVKKLQLCGCHKVFPKPISVNDFIAFHGEVKDPSDLPEK